MQKPYPPILLGSHGPRGMQRVIRYCDGWMPIAGRRADFPGQIARLRQLAEEAGRDPKTITVTAFAAPPDRKTVDEYAAGESRKTADSLAERVEYELAVPICKHADDKLRIIREAADRFSEGRKLIDGVNAP